MSKLKEKQIKKKKKKKTPSNKANSAELRTGER